MNGVEVLQAQIKALIAAPPNIQLVHDQAEKAAKAARAAAIAHRVSVDIWISKTASGLAVNATGPGAALALAAGRKALR